MVVAEQKRDKRAVAETAKVKRSVAGRCEIGNLRNPGTRIPGTPSWGMDCRFVLKAGSGRRYGVKGCFDAWVV